MNETIRFILYLLVVSGVTYLVRMLPLVFFRKKITNRFIRSFLYYVPYTVLTVMTFPAVLYSTAYLASAIVGVLVAITLAYFKRGLITVAVGASLTVLVCELIIPLII